MRVIEVLLARVSVQSSPQEMPVAVTVPEPEPSFVTVMVRVPDGLLSSIAI